MPLSMNRVVIAEDNLDISIMMKDYFEEVYNLIVETTDSVDSIIPLVKETKASVLIMDLELSDGDASEVLKEVAAIPGLIVVVFTGTWEERQENELLENGAQVVMRKPQKPATIWQQVLNLRGIREIHRETRLKIKAKEAGVIYNSLTGTLTQEGGTTTILDDDKKNLLNLLADRYFRSQNQSKESKDAEGVLTGWVEKKQIIKSIFRCREHEVGGFTRVFGYRIRAVNETLGEYIAPEGNQEMIENKRVGRYESYYRLNPDVFVISELETKEK